MGISESLGLVLASTSPRRKDILKRAGFEFIVRTPGVNEIIEGDPRDIVVKNSVAKARSVPTGDNDVVIGADTIVVCNGEILGKPVDIIDARRMIRLQFEHPQEVITGICVLDAASGKMSTGFEVSGVTMKGTEDSVAEHLESGQWRGKAGAYGIQDKGPISIEVTYGEEDNVIGMPVTLLQRLLSLVGFRYPERTPAVDRTEKKR